MMQIVSHILAADPDKTEINAENCMANVTNPGGGYRKGDGAQEENLFRRSDYYQSLDSDVADKDRSERVYCTTKCELKQSTTFDEYYPMKEFGAIYKHLALLFFVKQKPMDVLL
ncbi:unnamed protein product [Rotaria sp. Silwood1]|nr:unnamed protein product [Rotaria sp. Silwood1]